MKNRFSLMSILLTFSLTLLLLSGCGKQNAAGENRTGSLTSGDTSLLKTSGMFSDRDCDASYDEKKSVSITLDGEQIRCSSDTVDISESTVTISGEGTYIFSGSLKNGMIIVNGKNTDKIQLVLNGVSINSDTSAAIYIAQADKVFLTLAPDSENILSNGGSFQAIDDNNIDAAIFSKDDLTINGEGALTIESPAGHGIVSKDDLVITGGKYNITSANQGLNGKESVRIADGTFTIASGKDGIHADDADDSSSGFVYLAAGTYNITADGDGISSSGDLQIEDGIFTIQTGGGSETVTLGSDGNWSFERPDMPPGGGNIPDNGNMPNDGGMTDVNNMPDDSTLQDTITDTTSTKGIKASGNLLINKGTFTLNSADDTLHSNANLTINGGTFELATGDDGIHADETAAVTGGDILITKSYEGIEGQNITVSGGTIDLTANDDGLNAAGGNDQSGNGGFGGFQGNDGFDAASDCSLSISGGALYINAYGDGIDSNGSLTVSGGETYISGPINDGNGALDYAGEAVISGGIFIAAGSSGMAMNFGNSSTQGAMLVSLSGSEGDVIKLADSSGTELLNWTVNKSFTCVLFSCPEIKQGETYTVSTGNTSQEITPDSLVFGSGQMDDSL